MQSMFDVLWQIIFLSYILKGLIFLKIFFPLANYPSDFCSFNFDWSYKFTSDLLLWHLIHVTDVGLCHLYYSFIPFFTCSHLCISLCTKHALLAIVCI